MNLNIQEFADSMIDAARDAVGDRWPQMEALATTELRRLAQSMADVGKHVAEGTIDPAHARQLIHIHQIASRSVLTTIKGFGVHSAEQVTRAAVRAVTPVLNRVLKFALL